MGSNSGSYLTGIHAGLDLQVGDAAQVGFSRGRGPAPEVFQPVGLHHLFGFEGAESNPGLEKIQVFVGQVAE